MSPQTSQSVVFVVVLLAILGLVALVVFVFIKSRRKIRAAQDDLAALGFVIERKPARELKDAAFTAVGAPKALAHGASKIDWVGVAEIDARRLTLLSHAYVVHTGHTMIVIRHLCVGVACPIRVGPASVPTRNAMRRWFVERLGMTVRPESWRREIAQQFLCDPRKHPDVAACLSTDAAQDVLATMPKNAIIHLAPGVAAVLRQTEATAQTVGELVDAARRLASVIDEAAK